MRNVRDIVRNFINDKTVRPKIDPGPIVRSDPPRRPVARSVQQEVRAPYTPPPVLEETGDPNCMHKWQVLRGVKSCWLCDAPYVDKEETDVRSKRDSTTTWRSRVYGRKED